MKVIKFFSTDNKPNNVQRIVWYSQDNTKRSAIVKRVESYLRINQLSCLMDVVKLYDNRKDFEAEYDQHKDIKAKFEYIYLGSD
jgi:hypothetical protein